MPTNGNRYGVKIELEVKEIDGKSLRSQIQTAIENATQGRPIKLRHLSVDLGRAEAARIARQLESAMASKDITIKIGNIDASKPIANLKKQLTTMLSGLSITGLKDFLGTDGVAEAYEKAAAAANKMAEAQDNARRKAEQTNAAMRMIQAVQKQLNSIYTKTSKVENADQLDVLLDKYREVVVAIEAVKNMQGDAQMDEVSRIMRVTNALDQQLAAEIRLQNAAKQSASASSASTKQSDALMRSIIKYREGLKKWTFDNPDEYGKNLAQIQPVLEALADEAAVSAEEFERLKLVIERTLEPSTDFANSDKSANKMLSFEQRIQRVSSSIQMFMKTASFDDGARDSMLGWLEELNDLSAITPNRLKAIELAFSRIQSQSKLGDADTKNEMGGLQLESRIENLRKEITIFKNTAGELSDADSSKLTGWIEELAKDGEIAVVRLQEINNEFAKMRNDRTITDETASFETEKIKSAIKITSFLASVADWENKNTKAAEKYKATLNDIKKVLSGTVVTDEQFAKAEQSFLDIKTSAKEAGMSGKSFFDMLKAGWEKFGGWTIVTRTMTYAINTVRKMYGAVKELDAAMTELKKVTDLTDASYARFANSAAQTAKRIGATVTDTVNATADFARLGYGLSDAAELAKAALVYKNVGDGVDDISVATESLISTIKAFGIEANDAMGIVDMFNQVGNNFAISSTGIGEALKRSASALATAGSTIEESIGIVTAMNAVVQNPESVGTAAKTLTMYLRAAKTEAEEAGIETDGMANSVSELRDELLKLTKVDIMLDED